MTWSKYVSAVIGAAVASVSVGCGGDNSSPTAPSATVVNERFLGTLAPSGSNTHAFRVAAAGTLEIVLTAVSPDAAVSLGVAVGTWNGSVCTVVTANQNARQNTLAVSGNALVGDFCVQVFDSGKIPANGTTNYTLQVNHT